MLKLFRHESHAKPPVSDDQIASLAYDLWQSRGCPDGDGSEDWQAAQAQLDAETPRPRRPGILGRFFSRLRPKAA